MPTYSPVVGNTLSDLQSALSARDRLLAEQNIASQGNTVKFTNGMQQMAAQRAALQQQAMQQAQANQLAQQAQADTGYFNRGRLANESDRIRADRMLAERAATDADRRFTQEDATRRFVAEQMAGARSGEVELAAQENDIVAGATNLAGLRNDRDYLAKQLLDLDTLEKKVPSKPLWDVFNRDVGNTQKYAGQMPPSYALDPEVGISKQLPLARTALQSKLSALDTAMAQLPPVLGQYVTQGQDNRWVSTFKPSGFFRQRPPSMQTNGVPSASTNSPLRVNPFQPANNNAAALIAEAQAAIARGANPDLVRQRLAERGLELPGPMLPPYAESEVAAFRASAPQRMGQPVPVRGGVYSVDTNLPVNVNQAPVQPYFPRDSAGIQELMSGMVR